jgi:hypothetical protein
MFFLNSTKNLHKKRKLKNSTAFKSVLLISKIFYRIKYRKEIIRLEKEILSFNKTFNEEDKRFILYCCRVALNSGLEYNEGEVTIKLPCREKIRDILHINKNSLPRIIDKMTEKGLIINTGNGKGGCNQEIFVKLDKKRCS